jgi:hypothetical protein
MTDKPSVPPTGPRPPTNLRELHRRTQRNLIIGGFIILFTVGGGLVFLFYGAEAMVGSWLCMGGAVAVLGVFYLIFKVLEAWSKSGDE